MSSTANPGRGVHAQAQQLLPWLLAGTLEGAELAMVQEHLGTCPQCQAELAWERRLRAAGQQRDSALDAGGAFERLLPRLGPQQPRIGIPGRWWNTLAANEGQWLRALAGAQFAAIAVLALLLVRPGADDAVYRTLGAGAQAQGNLVVTFAPETQERELRRILQASGARVAAGPTVTGAWVLAVPAAQARRALERLRAERAVTLAQPLAPESAP